MFKKLKTFVANKAEKIEGACAAALVAGSALGVIPTVCAAADPAKAAILKVLDVVYKIFRYIGIILAIWGIGSLVMAFKNEDADSKSRAIMSLVVGICLVSLPTLFGEVIETLLA